MIRDVLINIVASLLVGLAGALIFYSLQERLQKWMDSKPNLKIAIAGAFLVVATGAVVAGYYLPNMSLQFQKVFIYVPFPTFAIAGTKQFTTRMPMLSAGLLSLGVVIACVWYDAMSQSVFRYPVQTSLQSVWRMVSYIKHKEHYTSG